MSRNRSIDISKGIGIILMVLAHASAPHSAIVNRFHMALFFILSGWCFSDKNIESGQAVLKHIAKRIKGLYIPFLLFNSVTTLLRDFLIDINIYTDNPAFLEATSGGGNSFGITQSLTSDQLKAFMNNIFRFSGESQLGGATWFLRVMFGVSVAWCMINWILKSLAKFHENIRMGINLVLSIFFMFVSWKWMQEDRHFFTFFQMETVASSYIMFCAGYYLKRYYRELTQLQNIIMGVVFTVILIYCDNICSINNWSSSVNLFSNPYMYLLSSFSGFIAVFSFVQVLTKYRWMKIIEIIGQHTLAILLFHFLSFKLVTCLQYYIYKFPLYRIASFPVYNSTKLWWLLYTVVGIMVPLGGALIYGKVKRGCFKRIECETKISHKESNNG